MTNMLKISQTLDCLYEHANVLKFLQYLIISAGISNMFVVPSTLSHLY